MDYSPPGSSVQGVFQARLLEWVGQALGPLGAFLKVPGLTWHGWRMRSWMIVGVDCRGTSVGGSQHFLVPTSFLWEGLVTGGQPRS